MVTAKAIAYAFDKVPFLDSKNILWMYVDGKYIGKRSVYTKEYGYSWLEDTKLEDIKSWPCGENANYNEIFY